MPKNKNIVGRVVSLRCYGALYWVNVETVSPDGIRGTFVLRTCYNESGGVGMRLALKDTKRERNALKGTGLFMSPKNVRVLRREYI